MRCLDCREEYELPDEGVLVCPACGSAAWIAARIPAQPLEPAPS